MVRLLTTLSRLAVLLILIVIMAFLSKSFFTIDNLLNILRQAAPIFIIAAGQTVVILARGIDLSMDAVASLTGVVMATLMVDNNIPFYLAMPLGTVKSHVARGREKLAAAATQMAANPAALSPCR